MLNVCLTDSIHLYRDEDGKIYTPAIYSNVFFERYYNVFGRITLLAKVQPLLNKDNNFFIINPKYIELIELPNYRGFFSLMLSIPKIYLSSRKCKFVFNGFIFRMAQIESYLAFFFYRKKAVPYIVEVVNDPNKIMRFKMMNTINNMLFKYVVRGATGVSFVTKNTLQDRYSNHTKTVEFTSSYSSVELPALMFSKPRQFEKVLKKIKILHVSNTMAGNLKGHYTLFQIVLFLVKLKFIVECVVVGEGRDIKKYLDHVESIGLKNNVKFIGSISSLSQLAQYYRESDFLILPSSNEGLPRVVIEAMANGMICLATNVGGVIELIDESEIISINDIAKISEKIIELSKSPKRMSQISRENFNKSLSFSKELLDVKRSIFYNQFKNRIYKS
jgi:glycosyltransferase involved in cell wall biosynthesis